MENFKNLVYLINLKPSSHRTAEESLGVEYLASVLKQNNYEVNIIDNWLDSSISNEDVYNEIMSRKKDICFVGTSSYMLSNKPTLDLIKKLKEQGLNVVSGGYGPTFEPEIFLKSGTDVINIGEGEKTLVELAEYYLGKRKDLENIKGVGYLEKGQIKYTVPQRQIHDLDSIPFPTRPYIELLKKRKSTINVLTSRGCMGQCAFCSIAAFGTKHKKGKKWRARSILSIIEELKGLQEQGVSTVKFIDDSFIENERDNQWCKDFANALKEAGIDMQLRASIRADKVNAENMADLRRAGFISFSCGIENASGTALARTGKLAALKDNYNAVKYFKDNGIYVQAGFILFDNKTTISELKENHSFLSENIDLVTKGIFSEMFAAEGTEFTRGLEKNNEGKKLSSNKLYNVEDESARKVYKYLKKWQSNHAEIYDKVIDPISAPKAIERSRMKKYHELMITMKRIDLQFMQDLIMQVDRGGDLDNLYNSYVQKHTHLFEKCKASANRYYQEDGLQYDADINVFVTLNNIQNPK